MMNQLAKQMYKGRGKMGGMGANFGSGIRGFGRKKRLR